MTYEDKLLTPIDVIERALALKASYRDSVYPRNTTIGRSSIWEPPLKGCLKLNVDGAIFFDLDKTRVGCLVRDSKGMPLLAASSLEGSV